MQGRSNHLLSILVPLPGLLDLFADLLGFMIFFKIILESKLLPLCAFVGRAVEERAYGDRVLQETKRPETGIKKSCLEKFFLFLPIPSQEPVFFSIKFN